MEPIFSVNTALDVPIYQQLVDSIRLAIKRGVLPSGERLPTVQQLTKQLGIARGTVKRAYDELEHAGLIEKVQGRGTFVSYRPDNSESRKERAMAAISNMLDHLEEMGLSPSEINIFVNLKLRERSEKEANVKIAAVECNPETLSQISQQIHHIDGVNLYSFLLDNIRQYPYKLGEDFDLILTTSSHAEYLESVVPSKNHIMRMALRPATKGLSRIIKIAANKQVGIITYSDRFGELLYDTCRMYAEHVTVHKPMTSGDEATLKTYLKGKDVLLVPDAYAKLLSAPAVNAIEHFKGDVIACHYELDEGSLLYLETKIKRILDKKTI